MYCGDDAGNPSDAACTEPGYGLNPEFASVCDATQLRCGTGQDPNNDDQTQCECVGGAR